MPLYSTHNTVSAMVDTALTTSNRKYDVTLAREKIADPKEYKSNKKTMAGKELGCKP